MTEDDLFNLWSQMDRAPLGKCREILLAALTQKGAA
jgi:hypothetical protein